MEFLASVEKGVENVDNITIKIGERTIPLRFRMNQFILIEEEVGNLIEVRELILEGKNRIRNLISVIRILGNAGLKHAGEKDDLTDDWLAEWMEPQLVGVYQIAVLACLGRESESEAEKETNENKERDLVLEEINKKKDPVNLHTGG